MDSRNLILISYNYALEFRNTKTDYGKTSLLLFVGIEDALQLFTITGNLKIKQVQRKLFLSTDTLHL